MSRNSLCFHQRTLEHLPTVCSDPKQFSQHLLLESFYLEMLEVGSGTYDMQNKGSNTEPCAFPLFGTAKRISHIGFKALTARIQGAGLRSVEGSEAMGS